MVACAARSATTSSVAVANVLDRPERPEHVVLEASGVADPAGIAMTFLDSAHRARLRIDSIICVIDASQVFAAPEQEQVKLWQIACADMVVLNKTDLVDADDIARIRTWLDGHFHRYRLIEAIHGNVPLDLCLPPGGSTLPGGNCSTTTRAGTTPPGPPPRRGGDRPGFHHLDVRDRRADVAASARESGSPAARQRLPGQGHRVAAWRSPMSAPCSRWWANVWTWR